MRSLRYLNAILTAVAILLTVQLWMWWVGDASENHGFMVSPVHAQAVPVGLNNASSERRQIAELLKKLNHRTEELITLFRSGRARINVEIPSENGGPASE